MLDSPPRDIWLLEGGVNGRNPPLDCGLRDSFVIPRDSFAEFILEPRLLLLGGVNGRYPLLGCAVREAPLSDPAFEKLRLLLLLGGVNEREAPLFAVREFSRLPRFSFCVEPIAERLAMPPPSRPPKVPAFGFCMELLPAIPREAEFAFSKCPPAGTAPTWFCAIVCRRPAVCCWNEAGRAMLLCDPKKRCDPVL